MHCVILFRESRGGEIWLAQYHYALSHLLKALPRQIREVILVSPSGITPASLGVVPEIPVRAIRAEGARTEMELLAHVRFHIRGTFLILSADTLYGSQGLARLVVHERAVLTFPQKIQEDGLEMGISDNGLVSAFSETRQAFFGGACVTDTTIFNYLNRRSLLQALLALSEEYAVYVERAEYAHRLATFSSLEALHAHIRKCRTIFGLRYQKKTAPALRQSFARHPDTVNV